jgi:hypothetical protein
MRVVLDAQMFCDAKRIDGIPTFTYNLYKTLIKRGKNKYILSFFDKGKERGNREKLKEYFSEDEAEFSECNTISYRDALNDPNVFWNKTYAQATGASGDVYFCSASFRVPCTMAEKWIVTVYDFIDLLYKEELKQPFAFHIKAINIMKQWKPHIVAISEHVRQDVLK